MHDEEARPKPSIASHFTAELRKQQHLLTWWILHVFFPHLESPIPRLAELLQKDDLQSAIRKPKLQPHLRTKPAVEQ